MKTVIPVEKNKEYELIIASLGYEGEGIGKINDFTIFVPGALIKEKVKVRIIKISKNFAFGKLVDIIEPSEYRESPVCGIYTRCGGCQLQHFSYEAQLSFKKNRVKDCIERIGKLAIRDKQYDDLVYESEDRNEDIDKCYDGIAVHNVIGMKNPYRYRNKVQLPVREKNGEVSVGFYAKRSHEIIAMDGCSIQDETADKVIKLIKQWIKEYSIKTYNEEKHSGVLRHIMIRKAFKTEEVMVVIVTRSIELPYKNELISLIIKNIEGIKSIVQNINDKKTNVVLGQDSITIGGKNTISDYIGKFKFDISPLSFFQVNPIQTEVLYNKALEYADLKGNEIVFDAYCGTGTISLFLSQRAKKVYGVEIIAEAIENANINANQNNINNVEFIVGKSEEVIPELIKKGIRADVVVVDPPRKGCEKILLEAIAQMSPKKIVYVSCDPGTLARDLSILDKLGYKTLEIQPVDMFPQTAHIECVTGLRRKDL